MFYDHIHRTVRHALYSTNISVGSTDYEDKAAVEALATKLHEVLLFLRVHAENEERNLHPLVMKLNQGMRDQLEGMHEVFAESIDAMEAKMNAISAMAPNDRKNAGPELYRMFTHFIAAYLPHLDDEEYNVLPVLLNGYPHEHLEGVKYGLIGRIPPEHWVPQVRYQMHAMNGQERAGMLEMLHSTVKVSPQAFAAVCSTAEQVLTAAECAALKKELASRDVVWAGAKKAATKKAAKKAAPKKAAPKKASPKKKTAPKKKRKA
jgi:hypothetical protein